jgi:hypothetical protein
VLETSSSMVEASVRLAIMDVCPTQINLR